MPIPGRGGWRPNGRSFAAAAASIRPNSCKQETANPDPQSLVVTAARYSYGLLQCTLARLRGKGSSCGWKGF